MLSSNGTLVFVIQDFKKKMEDRRAINFTDLPLQGAAGKKL
ncbi:unnamed protein product [Brassica rapa subsp. trilocularis]